MNFTNQIFSKKPQQTLFHYTNQSGLLGIVKSGNLWATNIHYLNDYNEFALARRLAEDEINNQLSQLTDELKKKLLELFKRKIFSVQRTHIYLFSLSEEPDLLSQWMSYTSKTGGFSIGFESQYIQKSIHNHNFFLAPCVYRRENQEVLIKELLDEKLTLLEKSLEDTYEDDIENLLSELSNKFQKSFVRVAPIIKDGSFSEEKEWRIISEPIFIDNQFVNFRTGKSMIIPYFKLNIKNEKGIIPINEIIVGPTPHGELSVNSVSGLINEKCYGTYCQITKSQIPYRGW